MKLNPPRQKCKPLTAKEKKWIKELKELCLNRPPALWLFAAAGEACIMKTPANGQEMGSRNDNDSEAVNPDNHVDTIRALRCDGGDW